MLECRSTKRSNKEMEERIRVFEKKVEAQRFVMTNLRNGIDYLKDQGGTIQYNNNMTYWTYWPGLLSSVH